MATENLKYTVSENINIVYYNNGIIPCSSYIFIAEKQFQKCKKIFRVDHSVCVWKQEKIFHIMNTS